MKHCSITSRLKASTTEELWTLTAAKFNQWYRLVAKQGHCCFYLSYSCHYSPRLIEWHLLIACPACYKYRHYLVPLNVSKRRPTDFQPRDWKITVSIILQDNIIIRCSICLFALCTETLILELKRCICWKVLGLLCRFLKNHIPDFRNELQAKVSTKLESTEMSERTKQRAQDETLFNPCRILGAVVLLLQLGWSYFTPCWDE